MILNKKRMLITLLGATVLSVLCVNTCFAYNIIKTVEDDFESYEENADIVSFTAINSKTIPNDGRMTPAAGYKWAERYNSNTFLMKGFRPVNNPDSGSMVAELFNNDAGQFYRVSSEAISGCCDNTVILQGRFYIPDVSAISGGFIFGLVPNERYSSKVFEPFCSMISVDSNGGLYKSVKDDAATYGASDVLVEDSVIKSGIWYNAVFIAENSESRNYTGRVFTDDGTTDIEINGGYLAQTVSNGDSDGDNMRIGLKIGKSGSSSNKIYVDDLYMCTTDYDYNLGVPAKAIPYIEQAGANELTLSFGGTAFKGNAFDKSRIFLENSEGKVSPIATEYDTKEHKVILIFEDALLPDCAYTVSFSGITDIFGNKLEVFNYRTDKASVKIRDITYCIADDEVSVLKNGVITCLATVSNELQKDIEVSIVMALYKNGVMTAMSSTQPQIVLKNDSSELSGVLDCMIDGDVKEYELITYFWDGVESGCAISDSWCFNSSGVMEIKQ